MHWLDWFPHSIYRLLTYLGLYFCVLWFIVIFSNWLQNRFHQNRFLESWLVVRIFGSWSYSYLKDRKCVNISTLIFQLVWTFNTDISTPTHKAREEVCIDQQEVIMNLSGCIPQIYLYILMLFREYGVGDSTYLLQ